MLAEIVSKLLSCEKTHFDRIIFIKYFLFDDEKGKRVGKTDKIATGGVGSEFQKKKKQTQQMQTKYFTSRERCWHSDGACQGGNNGPC